MRSIRCASSGYRLNVDVETRIRAVPISLLHGSPHSSVMQVHVFRLVHKEQRS